jgi:hypothetical protein
LKRRGGRWGPGIWAGPSVSEATIWRPQLDDPSAGTEGCARTPDASAHGGARVGWRRARAAEQRLRRAGHRARAVRCKGGDSRSKANREGGRRRADEARRLAELPSLRSKGSSTPPLSFQQTPAQRHSRGARLCIYARPSLPPASLLIRAVVPARSGSARACDLRHRSTERHVRPSHYHSMPGSLIADRRVVTIQDREARRLLHEMQNAAVC